MLSDMDWALYSAESLKFIIGLRASCDRSDSPGRRRLDGSRCRLQSLDCGSHLGRNAIHIAQRQCNREYRVPHAHLYGLALDVVSVHGKKSEGVDECDRHDIGLGLDREKKCTWQKRLKLAIAGTAAFGENDQRHTAAQTSQRRFHRADRSRWVLLVDADLPGTLQMPSDKWIHQQFTLENDAELKWQMNVEDRNVERRGMRARRRSAPRPVTFTGERIVFITSHDQRRANLCWMRPSRSKSEQNSEI